jgi:hypothetical protein
MSVKVKVWTKFPASFHFTAVLDHVALKVARLRVTHWAKVHTSTLCLIAELLPQRRRGFAFQAARVDRWWRR